jgi:large subunit ribosomal protein L3
MKGIIGKKLGMTQVYTEDGRFVPVTVIEAGPCPVLALRTAEKNGYSAVQLGFGSRHPKNASRALLGHVAAAGVAEAPPAVIREIRLDQDPAQGVGDTITADSFAADEYVDVVGRTKGRGFQGVVKRWRFGGGRASHGKSGVRRPGSIGMCVKPGHVIKGKRMPGHMGNARRTVQGLQIVEVRSDDNLIFVRGAVPGPNGGVVVVRAACKK